MYGTIARLRVKPGMESTLIERFRELDGRLPGARSVQLYRADGGTDEFYVAVAFESREAYTANANSPEQHARHLRIAEALIGEPEWHDGEIVYAGG